MRKFVAVAALATAAAAAGAVAQQPDQPKGTPDTDRVIRRNIAEIGSRIASHRVCMTAAQWAEQRRLQRMDTEHTQSQQSVRGGQ
jgi:hypothetical protein